MIDTLAMIVEADHFNPPDHWHTTVSEKVEKEQTDEVPHAKFRHTDPVSGARVEGPEFHRPERFEVSVPRLTLGKNSRCLTWETTNKAIARTVDCLRERCTNLNVKHVTRVDVVCQFEGNPSEVIAAHANTPHPRVRAKPLQFFDSTVYWKGRERVGRLYDKELEENGSRDGRTIRMEWQLRGSALKDAFFVEKGEKLKVEKVTGLLSYYALRELTLPLQPPAYHSPNSIVEFLAACDSYGHTDPIGRPISEVYMSMKSSRTARRLRKGIASCRPRVHQFDWNEILPDDPREAKIITRLAG